MTTPKSNFTLLRDKVMVYPIKAKRQTDTGIIVTAIDPNSPIEGFVVACGPGKANAKGKFIPMDVEVGNRVLFIKSKAEEVKHQGDTFLVISAEDIICTLEVEA